LNKINNRDLEENRLSFSIDEHLEFDLQNLSKEEDVSKLKVGTLVRLLLSPHDHLLRQDVFSVQMLITSHRQGWGQLLQDGVTPCSKET